MGLGEGSEDVRVVRGDRSGVAGEVVGVYEPL